jgi:UDP-N-acetylglucosamine 2-epimerase (non-hydrolysing)
MIDTLKRMLPIAESRVSLREIPDRFALVTLHRPSNVDDPIKLGNIAKQLINLSRTIAVIFPVHPRTRKNLEVLGFSPKSTNPRLVEPMDYLEFIMYQKRATVVITDSGEVQEETTFLGVPCLTFRENTERPVTIEYGTNTILGENPTQITKHLQVVLDGKYKIGTVPEYWDGMAENRIRDVILGLSP